LLNFTNGVPGLAGTGPKRSEIMFTQQKLGSFVHFISVKR